MKPEKQSSKLSRDDGHDFTVKVVILGNSGVGKTNIITRYCDNQFNLNYMPTIGVDLRVKTVTVDNKRIKMHIWDTAGQERFKDISKTYFKGAIGIILAYSITDMQSFNEIGKGCLMVENWISQVHENTTPDVKKILIANKCDLEEERKVTEAAGRKLAAQYQMPFLEVSAKNGINIEEIFTTLGHQITELADELEKAEKERRVVRVSNVPKPEESGGCRC